MKDSWRSVKKRFLWHFSSQLRQTWALGHLGRDLGKARRRRRVECQVSAVALDKKGADTPHRIRPEIRIILQKY